MTTEPLRRFPSPLLLREILKTATVLWILTRFLIAATLGPGGGSPWPSSFLNSLLVLATVASLFLLEIRVARQRIFFGNLGLSRRFILSLALLWAGLLELLAGWAVRGLYSAWGAP